MSSPACCSFRPFGPSDHTYTENAPPGLSEFDRSSLHVIVTFNGFPQASEKDRPSSISPPYDKFVLNAKGKESPRTTIPVPTTSIKETESVTNAEFTR
jgi:hypothetical protein